MTTSLIISTYNRPDALWLTLLSVLGQTKFPDEIIIADDGSTVETKNLIQQFEKDYHLKIIHVWHEDHGFRLAAIRNKSIAISKCEYIIQIDGDLILHKRFIEDHIKWAKPNIFISGTRCVLEENYTNFLIQIKSIKLPPFYSNNIRKIKYGIHLNFVSLIAYLINQSKNNYKYVLGCNMSFWKKDLTAINGYNESFVGWGKEDNDISIRLINNSKKLKIIKFNCVIYHLYHKEQERLTLKENDDIFTKSIYENFTSIENGLNKYL